MHAFTSVLLAIFVLSAQAGDEEIFKRAQDLWDQGQQVEALKAVKELIKHYPTSKYVPEAYLMIAEYYFDNAQLDKALLAYKKITQYKNSKVYSFALYKMGWCYFNLNKFDKALAQFVSVVKYCDKQERDSGGKNKLCVEVLNDLALTYSHVKGAKTAPAFFQKLAPNEAGKLLLALAGMYFGDGKYKDAMEVYRHLIGKAGCSPDALFHQLKIIDCVVRLGSMQSAPPEVRKLVDLFAQLDKCLPKPSEEQKEALDRARETAEQTLYDLAVFSSDEASATKEEKALRLTRELAESYLKLFPASHRSAEIRDLLK